MNSFYFILSHIVDQDTKNKMFKNITIHVATGASEIIITPGRQDKQAF